LFYVIFLVTLINLALWLLLRRVAIVPDHLHSLTRTTYVIMEALGLGFRELLFLGTVIPD